MVQNIEYLGNAQIINSLAELPKIADGRKYHENAYCISINAYEYEDIEEVKTYLPEAEAKKYLFFKVYYCETKGKYMCFGDNTFHFLYCILKENIK